ncbi:unnamed protein product [Oncorhynchus mykiss]|uniref:Uncharacterized protein n=1 Tax=Oncorhynchus mykiss TaxID=8022 RepID=A0A060XA42_ONCMY|nr:unnamed protein product [Oncorhynchus mykiss]
MSSVTRPEARGQGSDVDPLRYKPFSSHAHYQQASSTLSSCGSSTCTICKLASLLLNANPSSSLFLSVSDGLSNCYHYSIIYYSSSARCCVYSIFDVPTLHKLNNCYIKTYYFPLFQVLCAVRKLQESGFYWGAVGGREASALLRSQPPGTFLVRDSSDHHYFFTLSVQTARGTKNLRIHSQGGSFYLQPDPHCTHTPPRFDCVLKLIGHYMGKEGGGGGDGEAGAGTVGTGSLYLIHSGGEKVPLELRRPLPSSLSSLQHLCRRTLNGHLGGPDPPDTHQLPHTLRDFLAEYDAPI